MLDEVPTLGWVDAPSPVTKAPETARRLGLDWLGFERDGLLPGLYGSSKVRKLDTLRPAGRPSFDGCGTPVVRRMRAVAGRGRVASMMPATPPSARVLGVVAWAVLLGISGLLGNCGPNEGGDPAGEYEGALSELAGRVIAEIGDDVIAATLADFVAKADAVEAAAGAWAANPTQQTLDLARVAWIEAASTWQHAEVMPVEPDLRDEVYSWPTTNACRVDQETVRQSYLDGLADLPVNVRGLDALEGLLFAAGPDNRCKPNSAINRDGRWAALTSSEITARRADYAAAAATDLATRARAVEAQWAERLDELEPNATGLEVITDALFYLDTRTKDRKLAVSADGVESPLAARSKEHVRDNLLGFQRVLSGLDDLLVARGAEGVRDDIGEAIVVALNAVDAIEGPLSVAKEADPGAVEAAREAVGTVTGALKGPVMTSLSLEIPEEAAGDTD